MAPQPTLLHTKLSRPAPAEAVVPRLRAWELLERGARGPLTLVSAPAGYGKTSLVAGWLEIQEQPAGWLSLDAADADLRRFLRHLVAALRTAVPDACPQTLALLDSAAPASDPAVCLANELAAIDEDFVLVLDDFHLVGGSEVPDLVTALLRHPPASMHVVVVARGDPSLPLAALRARGHLTEIRREALRFDEAETLSLFEQLAGVRLDAASLSHLERELEGWVVGLRLACLALRSQQDASAFVSRLRGGLPAIQDYLIEEVLAGLSGIARERLLFLSILDRFCAPLCEALWETSDEGQDILERIEKDGLFLVPLDAERHWYRYHHVFQDLLRRELHRQLDPEAIAALHARAGRWLAQAGLIEEALHHALEAGDSAFAAHVVTSHRHILMNREEWHRLLAWCETLPPEVVEGDAALCLAQAWALHFVMRLGEARRVLARGEHLISERDDAALRAEAHALRAIESFTAGNARQTKRHAECALEGLSDSAACLRGYTCATLAWAHQADGDALLGVEKLSRDLETHRFLGVAYHARVLLGSCMLHFREGDIRSVLPAANRLLELGLEHRLPESTVYGRAFLGWSHLLRDELDAAREHLEAAVRDRHVARRRWFSNCAYALSLCLRAQAHANAAREVAELVVRFALDTETGDMLVEARAFEAELALREGRMAEARGRLAALRRVAIQQFPYFYVPRLTLAKIRLAEGTPDGRVEAVTLLGELRNEFDASFDKRHLVDVLAVEALARDAGAQRAEALASVQRALELGEPGGAVLPFADLGAPMASLLARLPGAISGTDYVCRIRGAIDRAAPSVGAEGDGVLVERLSGREQDVLRLLALRLRDKEIAERLCIAPGTVKSHVKRLYRKLDVADRRHAVTRAREIGLLEPEPR